MFGFLKKKLKETVDKFSKKVDESAEVIDDSPLLVDESSESFDSTEETLVESELIDSEKDLVSETLESPASDNSIDSSSEQLSEKQMTNPVSSKELSQPETLVVDSSTESSDRDLISSGEEPVDDSQTIRDEKIFDSESIEQSSLESDVKNDEIKAKSELSEEFESFSDEDLTLADQDDSISEIKKTVSPASDIDVEETPEKKGFLKKLFSKKSSETVESESVSSTDEHLANASKKVDDSVISDDSLDGEIIDAPERLIEDEIKSELKEDADLISDAVSTPASSKEIARKDLLDESVEDSTKKKKSFFSKIKSKLVKFQLTEEVFEDLFWDLELALLENNVALEVIEKIKKDLHDQLTKENVTRKSVDEVLVDTLKKSLEDVLDVPSFDLIEKVKTKKPFVINVVGVNGSGKTTTIGKLIRLFQNNNLSVVVAAADTFRAAAIQQLQEHTDRLGVRLIKHDYNSDPSAVAFDAIKHATAKNIDVVIIDTAGRLQSNSNLMDELRKLVRVNKPDLNLFIGESITGNDCVEQAVAFNDAVGIDAIILSKADIDDKGGAALSISYVTKKPILYLGVGQTYDDLKPFSKQEILDSLGL